MQKIVVDSNVVISAGIGSNACGEVLIHAIDFEIISPKIQLKEFDDFLKKERKVLNSEAITRLKEFFEFYESIVSFEDPKKFYNFSQDPSDDAFISLAYEKEAILVSGDKEVLALSKTHVRSFAPREYLKFIGY